MIKNKFVEGIGLAGACERDGASTRNFLVKKYPCPDKPVPRKNLF